MPKVGNNGRPPVDPLASRIRRLGELLALVTVVPLEWLREPSSGSGENVLKPVECRSYVKLVESWEEALEWSPGLDKALSVMLASITSTKSVGEQLWIKLLGPASCGKSTLSESVSVARKYVYPKDTFTGLTSGYQTDADGSENLSLADKLKNKTLIITDGDTLLQLPNLGQVLSQLRAFYSRNIRSQYKNKMSHDHEGISTTIIICGTNSLKKLDTSELGERFLDCVIMDRIDEDLEEDVLWRVADRADENMGIEADGKVENQYEPELVTAMQLTGGYVEYLRENATELLKGVTISRKYKKSCIRLGQFIAYMRARPAGRGQEKSEREFGARLVNQLVRLAKCLAVVLNKSEVDDKVINRVREVSLDTARGQTLEMAAHLYDMNKTGSEVIGVALAISRGPASTAKLLWFLREIGVVDRSRKKTKGVTQTWKWRLTDTLYKLYEEVLGDDE